MDFFSRLSLLAVVLGSAPAASQAAQPLSCEEPADPYTRVSARVVDVEGRPLAAHVTVLYTPEWTKAAATDARGWVAFEPVFGQHAFALRASLEGYRQVKPQLTAQPAQAAGPSVESSLTVRPATHAAPPVVSGTGTAQVDIVMEPIAPIRGRVVDSSGRPQRRFRLSGNRQWLDSPDGTFVYPYAWPELGKLGLQVELESGAKSGVYAVPAGTLEPVEVEVPPTRSLTLTVLDEGGAPVKGARVHQTFPSPADRRRDSASTNGSGRVVLTQMPRTSKAVIIAAGFAWAEVTLAAPATSVRMERLSRRSPESGIDEPSRSR